ncbi:MAG TPA: molybdenum cofactor guanylyltransferase [Vicinamibacterales bacterium]|jgi:molybdopterin-guanine dinucleotide biosynthesis protein A|nr:molybdenum cofactor guanylyltransferase [Vicinamibacterales bacterium]
MARAAILAGGRARRFGGIDKSSLVVDGQTILDRQMAMLQTVDVIREIMIVGATASHRSARRIVDRVSGCGPLGGIHAALTAAAGGTPIQARGNAVFVLACDMPYVPSALVTYLLDLAQNADAVIPLTEAGYHPLCAVYSLACLDPVGRRLAEGRLQVVGILDDVKARVVTVAELDRFGDPHRLLMNVNTPVDYLALQTSLSHQP